VTLTTRLSVFFLGTLGLVLAGFSALLYGLAHTYLHRQLDDRLGAALNTLAAAAEISPQGVEWEPHERLLFLGPEGENDPVRWVVCDDVGRVVGSSRAAEAEDFLAHSASPLSSEPPFSVVREQEGQPWHLGRRRVSASEANIPAASQREQGKYAYLDVTVGLPLRPLHATLRNLALLLGGLSLGLWLLAALVGRWLCRRALVPVTRMAATARSMSAADLTQRLPSPGTHDELEDLGQAFNDLLARVQESFERQRRFTGDASHQLRTPLAAMLGQVEVALRRERTPAEYRQALTEVQGQVLRLRQIVEMLLFLARADAEAKLPHLEAIDLGPWLREHVASWSGHPRFADLRLEDSPAGPVLVHAHGPLLGQLVDNLLENACKYSTPGTLITLGLTAEPDTVCLAVQDAGHGIAEEDLPHIFEPFYRSAEARRQGRSGIGLGLAIARRIATAFGGSLDVQSQVGQGSCFTLRLPAYQPEASARE
jgi:heavy metal sensor kinase